MNKIQRSKEIVVRILKEYISTYLLAIIVLLFVQSAKHLYLGIYDVAGIDFFGLFIHIIILITVYRLPFDYVKPFISIYIFILCLFLGIYVLDYWESRPLILIWFLLIPFGIKNLFSFRITLLWCVVLSLFISICLYLQGTGFSFYLFEQKKKLSDSEDLWRNIISIITYLAISGVIIYYDYKISNALIDDLIKDAVNENRTGKEQLPQSDENQHKFESLFEKISDYFNEKQPWKDANFTIEDLAYVLNSNVKYISIAISENSGLNFKTFVNSYRVEYIKKILSETDAYARYSLLHIYTEAGFKHQSTFNRVFKQLENMTPSEFLEKLKTEEQDN